METRTLACERGTPCAACEKHPYDAATSRGRLIGQVMQLGAIGLKSALLCDGHAAAIEVTA